MPPKKDAVAAPVLDTNPFGAFINVSVDSAVLQLELPTAPPPPPPGAKATKGAPPPPEGPPKPPQTHITVIYPGDWAPLTGTPTATVAEDGASCPYPYAYVGKFRREPTQEAVLELINGTVKLCVHESGTNTRLGTATVDVLEFGMGAQALELGDLTLIPEPQASVPPGVAKLLAGSLSNVRLWVTRREAPAAPDGGGVDGAAAGAGGGGSRPGTAASHATATTAAARPKGSANKQGAEDAGAAIPEDQLPEPKPWTFVPTDAAVGATVVEVQVGGIEPLPANLPAVVSSATEGKGGGKLTFSVALALPAGPSLVLGGGTLQAAAADGSTGARIAWGSGSRRAFMTRQQVAAWRDALKDGVPLRLEVARYLVADTQADPAWEGYHATAVLPGGEALLEPGTCEVPGTAVVPLTPFDATAAASVLPAYTPVQGKTVKNIEEADVTGTSAWAAAGAQLVSVSLRLARPLVQPWAPPPPPPQPLLAAVPARPELVHYEEPRAASDAFVDDLKAMARAVAALQLQGQVPLAGGSLNDGAAVAELSRALAATGQLQELKASLKKHAVRVALERLRAGMDGTPLDEGAKAVALRDLHTYLTGLLSTAMDDLRAGGSDQGNGSQRGDADVGLSVVNAGPAVGSLPAQGSVAEQLAHMAKVAGENEVQGVWSRAEALHQRCVVVARDADASSASAALLLAPSAWYEYGAFCLRRGPAHQGRAEECLRKALEADPEHEPSLTALALLQLHQGTATDRLHLREALSIVRRLASHPTPAPSLQPSLLDLSSPDGSSAAAATAAAAAAAEHILPTQATSFRGAAAPGEQRAGSPRAWGLLLLVTQALGEEARSADVGAALAALARAEAEGLVIEPGPEPTPPPVGSEGSNHTVLAGSAGRVSPTPGTLHQASAQHSQVSVGAGSQLEGGPAPPAVSLRPGTHPFEVNGLAAVAALAAELALPAVALAALQAAAGELPTSAALPGVAYEMQLTGAAAYLWMCKWEMEVAGGGTLGHATGSAASRTPQPAPAAEAEGGEGAAAGTEGGEGAEVGEEAAGAAVVSGAPGEGARARATDALESALALCASAQEAADVSDIRPHSLRGEVLHTAGRWAEAVQSYVMAVQVAAAVGDGPPPLGVFLHLAASYHALGKPDYALDVYLQACAQQPCASAWLGVAAARGSLGDAAAAEAALARAASLDPENPAVWGALARAAVRAGRGPEGGAALATALRFGLSDAGVMEELAQGFAALGCAAETRSAMEAAVAAHAGAGQSALPLRVALAELLMDAGDAVGARVALEGASAAASEAEEMAAVHALVPRLIDLQLRAHNH